MSRGFERERLFATLLASRPQRALQLRVSDFGLAAVAHLALASFVIWLTTNSARPALALESTVRTLVLTDNTAISLRSSDGASATNAATQPAATHASLVRKLAVALPQTPLLPDLAEVASAIDASVKSIASIGAADELIDAAASALGRSLARDTLPHIPSIEELSKGPVLTAYTSGPELLNRKDIAKQLQERYPPDLVEMDETGLTSLWLLIDKDGAVRQERVAHSSGRYRLDRVALAVAPNMKFKPAFNHGYATPVWVQLPVRFQIVYQ